MSDEASGLDLYAALQNELVLKPGKMAVVPTGISVAIPQDYEMQVRPRSGLAAKHGISIVNAPGTIDADYRGEIKVILINHGCEPFRIARGDRIAQMVLQRVEKVEWLPVDSLESTSRAQGGFGHTGFSIEQTQQ